MSVSKTFLAKALYDNIAETPDELAFRRGDVLTVVQVDTNGLEGWWLCSLRGKQGIAPGNRLKLLTGMSNSHNDSLYQTPPGGINRNSWETTPNQQAIAYTFHDDDDDDDMSIPNVHV